MAHIDWFLPLNRHFSGVEMRKYIVFIVFALSISFSADAMLSLPTIGNIVEFPALSLPVWWGAYKDYNTFNSNDQNLNQLPDMPEDVKLWCKKEIKKHSIPSVDSIVFKMCDDDDANWCVDDGKVVIIQCGKKRIDKLNEALKSCSNDDSADEQKVIATNSWIVKHEIGHVFGKHTKNSINFRVLAPFAVQAFVSTVNYGAKKIFGMNRAPKTIPGLIGVSLGSIISKLSIGYGFYYLYKRYQERQADLYACENSNREELIAGRDFFLADLDDCIDCYNSNPTITKKIKLKKNHPFMKGILKFLYFINTSKNHPYPGDRADAIGRALQEFDQKNT